MGLYFDEKCDGTLTTVTKGEKKVLAKVVEDHYTFVIEHGPICKSHLTLKFGTG